MSSSVLHCIPPQCPDHTRGPWCCAHRPCHPPRGFAVSSSGCTLHKAASVPRVRAVVKCRRTRLQPFTHRVSVSPPPGKLRRGQGGGEEQGEAAGPGSSSTPALRSSPLGQPGSGQAPARDSSFLCAAGEQLALFRSSCTSFVGKVLLTLTLS